MSKQLSDSLSHFPPSLISVREPADPHRPQYHFSAPTGWINDPNGLIQWNGDYHLFYQYHPHSPYWGPMHWGHAISKDLAHWQHLPIALFPEKTDIADDKSGVFSGSAVDDNGTLTLIYTDFTDVKAHPGAIAEKQAIATSRDGIHFEKYAGNPVISAVSEGASAGFRDPKVWREADGVWSMVVGSGHEGKGRIHLYRSADLRQWTYHGVAFEGDGATGKMWECPDLFPLGGKHVLLVSVNEPPLQAVLYFLGEYRNGRFTPEKSGQVDFGPDFYAPQTFQDDEGRRIMIAWMDRWGGKMPTQTSSNWAGAMALPRELFLRPDGDLGTRPVPELQQLRAEGSLYAVENLVLHPDTQNPLTIIQGDVIEVIMEMQITDSTTRFGLDLCRTADGREKIALCYDRAANVLTLDRNLSGIGDLGIFSIPVTLMDAGTLKLHLYLDRSSLEMFVNDGSTAATFRIYPHKHDIPGIALYAEHGTVVLTQFELWEIQPNS